MTDKPYLLLNRLVVTFRGRPVYDQRFHAGVNIIRGENSSGKSTISDMIFYVLGGENITWTDEAAACDSVFGEFDVAGLTLSLSREISSENIPPSIGICEGALSETMKSQTGWSHYGRQRRDNKESFSQFMFDHLGLPQTKTSDSQANVTIYQILRLIYGDQNTDCTSIFRKERNPMADRQDIRRSIGEMLLGIDDLQSHELRQEHIQLTKHLAQKKTRFESLLEAAEKTEPNFRLMHFVSLVKQAQEEQLQIEKTIEIISNQREHVEERSKEEQAEITNLEGLLKNQNSEVQKLQNSINSLSLSLADSEVFIASLESDLKNLLAANSTRDLIGGISLSYCPICLADLTPQELDCCVLCKSHIAGSEVISGRLRCEQELKLQINESKIIFIRRKEILAGEGNSLKVAIINRNQTLSQLRTLVTPTLGINVKLAQLLKAFGYLTRKIEDLTRLEVLQTEIISLEEEVATALKRLNNIERMIKRRIDDQEARREFCQQSIGDLTIDILHEDIIDTNNETLSDANGLIFSFEKDFLSVRHGRLSASTQVFLKNSFYLALLKFSIEDDQCRLPRFFILDNIEDKGMVPERFRKFHNLLIQYSEQVSIPHQVILTTSYIDPALNDSKYCVGPSYNQPPYTLDLKGEWGVKK